MVFNYIEMTRTLDWCICFLALSTRGIKVFMKVFLLNKHCRYYPFKTIVVF